MNKFGQSIYDTLISLMPGLKDRLQGHGDYIDPIAANSLFQIWRTGERKVNDKVFKKPPVVGQEEVIRMKDAGLVKQIGDNLEITEKGAKVIRIMVLGDNRSIFEDSDLVIDYNKALNTTRGVKTAKNLKAAQGWWDRFEEEPKPKYQCKCGAEYDKLPTKRVGDEIMYYCPACGGGQFTPDPNTE